MYRPEDDYPGFNILRWWKATYSKYLTLAKIAKDIMAIPIFSVAFKFAVSTGGRVVETYRSSLSPSVVEALICTQDWIRMSSKVINEDEYLTNFDDLGKEIPDKLDPTHRNPEND